VGGFGFPAAGTGKKSLGSLNLDGDGREAKETEDRVEWKVQNASSSEAKKKMLLVLDANDESGDGWLAWFLLRELVLARARVVQAPALTDRLSRGPMGKNQREQSSDLA